MRRLGIALTALAMLPAPAASGAHGVSPVQPGAPVLVRHAGGASSSCTLNFIFETTSPARKYIGTAGHCAEKVGDIARTVTPDRELGKVVYREYQSAPGVDFALIEIDATRHAEIVPGVRSFGGPTGATSHTETQAGDLLGITGYGIVFGSFAQTRDRYGVLVSDNANEYAADMLAVNGDSGAPVIHLATGKGLGIVGSWGFPFTTDVGPTLSRILTKVRNNGFPTLQLVTAPRH